MESNLADLLSAIAARQSAFASDLNATRRLLQITLEALDEPAKQRLIEGIRMSQFALGEMAIASPLPDAELLRAQEALIKALPPSWALLVGTVGPPTDQKDPGSTGGSASTP